MKIRIMFVCHGNICRSPMAEFIMKKLLFDAGLSDKFLIESSATSTEEIWNGIGSPFYPPAKDELKRHGIPFSERRATLLKKSDYSDYDMFIGMDVLPVGKPKAILTSFCMEKKFCLLTFKKNRKHLHCLKRPLNLPNRNL